MSKPSLVVQGEVRGVLREFLSIRQHGGSAVVQRDRE
jgi:hypothetical protein